MSSISLLVQYLSSTKRRPSAIRDNPPFFAPPLSLCLPGLCWLAFAGWLLQVGPYAWMCVRSSCPSLALPCPVFALCPLCPLPALSLHIRPRFPRRDSQAHPVGRKRATTPCIKAAPDAEKEYGAGRMKRPQRTELEAEERRVKPGKRDLRLHARSSHSDTVHYGPSSHLGCTIIGIPRNFSRTHAFRTKRLF